MYYFIGQIAHEVEIEKHPLQNIYPFSLEHFLHLPCFVILIS